MRKNIVVLSIIMFSALIWAQFRVTDTRRMTYKAPPVNVITLKVVKNRWKRGTVKMGTYNGDVNPYPIIVNLAPSVSVDVNVTVPIPPGSVVTSGVWHVTGSNTGGVFPALNCVAPDAASHYLTSPGDTAMTADDIAGINASGTFVFQYSIALSETCTSEVSVTLTGTFPPPTPPESPVKVGTASSGIIDLCLLNIRDARCMMGLQSIYVSQNVSAYVAPFGVQILRQENPSFLTITPGLINLNGVAGNSQCVMRIYREILGTDRQWIQSPTHKAPPIHCQLAAMPVLIPWDGPEQVFIEFGFLSSPLPANSALEFSISPILMQGRSA